MDDAAADRVLRAATVTIDPVDPSGVDARAALSQYFGELDERFRSGFDRGEAGTDNDAAALRPPDGAFLVMRCDQTPIGCGGLQRIDAHTSEIKRMWIHRDWRGLGLGRRLLARLEADARTLGPRRLLLDTNETLTEAIAIYERAGYQATERYNDNPYAHHWFTKDI